MKALDAARLERGFEFGDFELREVGSGDGSCYVSHFLQMRASILADRRSQVTGFARLRARAPSVI